MLTAMEVFCKKHEGLSKLPLLIDEMMKKNNPNEGNVTPQFSHHAYRVSRVVIRAQENRVISKMRSTGAHSKIFGRFGILQELPIEHRFKLAFGSFKHRSVRPSCGPNRLFRNCPNLKAPTP